MTTRRHPGAKPGEMNHNWKGGRSVASNGYVLIKMPEHPAADVRGYVYEHRFVAEQKIGRYLVPGEQIHHINHNKADNRPENLEVTASRAHHAAHHRRVRSDLRLPGEANPLVVCACGCNATFEKYDKSGRPRLYITGHNSQANPKPASVACACGCGEQTSPGCEWLPGHHKRGRANG